MPCRFVVTNGWNKCQGLVQTRGAELDDVFELSQSCFDVWAQLIEALRLTWIVGDSLSDHFKQLGSGGL
jgi:hypothetical protein